MSSRNKQLKIYYLFDRYTETYALQFKNLRKISNTYKQKSNLTLAFLFI